jgi:hypothetical protein
MKTLVLLTLVACANVNGQPKPILVTVPEGTFEFSKLTLFHVSTSSGKLVADLNGTVDNNTKRPWVYTRFRLVATGHTPEAPQKKIVKEIEFNIMELASGGPEEFRYPLDPMPFFEVDSFRLTWLEGKATTAGIKAENEAENHVFFFHEVEIPITYQVGGSTNTAFVTYRTAGGIQQKEVSVPWSETVSVLHGAFLYISAQNRQRQGSGTVSVQIMYKRQVLKEAASEGAHAAAITFMKIE